MLLRHLMPARQPQQQQQQQLQSNCSRNNCNKLLYKRIDNVGKTIRNRLNTPARAVPGLLPHNTILSIKLQKFFKRRL